MQRKKTDYFVFAIAVILIIIVLLIGLITFSATRPEQVTPEEILPSPTPTEVPAQTNPPVLYDPEAQDLLLERIENRAPISQSDNDAKELILTSLPEGSPSGILYTSPNVQIDYTASADIFQVEVLTIDVQSAKDEANVWFRAMGMSQDAICELPVQFYLNYSVAEQMRDLNATFTPVGNGCLSALRKVAHTNELSMEVNE